MSEAAPSIDPRALRETDSVVRLATHDDLPAIAVAVCSLLVELGGKPAAQPALQQAARAVLDDPLAGALFVASDSDGTLVGFLGVSWQRAVRIPGRYGLIQELWVHPDWRGRSLGGALLASLDELARRNGVERIEVGLPSERFDQLPATEAFYAASGYTVIGTRMRRLL